MKSKKSSKAVTSKQSEKTIKTSIPCQTERTESNPMAASDISGVSYYAIGGADPNTHFTGVLTQDKVSKLSTETEMNLYKVQGYAIELLFKAHNTLMELASVRLECKLSNTRVMGVARELKELIKVMSVYDC